MQHRRGQWSGRETDRLIDLIYDAALDEALWPAVLERVGDRVGAHAGNLTQLNFIDGHGFGLAARAPEDIMARYFADWAPRNPIALAENPADYTTGWAPRITRDSESVDRRLLERSAFWNEFLVPIGAHHLTILRLSLRGSDVTTITLGRPDHHGVFEDDDIARLRPIHRHLVRAERLWRSLGLRQAALDQFDTLLATSSHALFFLDDQLAVLRRTAAADALLTRGGALRVVSGRLHAHGMAIDAAVQHALASALRGGAPSPVAIVGRRPEDGVMLSVARLGERAMAGVSGARCLLVSARPLVAPDPAAAVRERWGLTTAEAELALALRAGETLRTVAARREVSINTIRNQLGAIFDKTGSRRQQDLVRLLLDGPM